MNNTRSQSKPEMYIRATVFWFFHILTLCFVVALEIIMFAFPIRVRSTIASSWARMNIPLLKYICGVNYKVEGLENIPQGGAIALCNHQSTWETLALQKFLPLQVWVLKKELLKVPVFGWGLALAEPIAIDRKAGRKAIDQMIEQGKKKLDEGRWIVIYPEGTRIDPGVTARYKMGGAILAASVDYPVLPVAHNAGEFWPKHSFVKWPGTITLCIGPVIYPQGRSAEEIHKLAVDWIETKKHEIADESRWHRAGSKKKK